MSNRYLLFMIIILLLASLACSALDGSPESASNATVTVIATPTLASTATPDPDIEAGAGDGTVVAPDSTADPANPDGSGEPTPETGLDSTADPGENGESEDPGNGSGDENGEIPVASAVCPAPGQNLLINPSFEGQFKPYGAFNELNHAPNWFPWWKDGDNNLRPEFKPAEITTAPHRVHSGSSAQQYFKSFGQFKAGLFQSVLGVPVGSKLQFSSHGLAWSCEEFSMCPDGSSVNPANMLMRVGIDPTGDTDHSADTVQWSEYFNPLDQWQVACVEAVAERDIVTVFVWASPDGPRQNQDVYWDDASLVVVP